MIPDWRIYYANGTTFDSNDGAAQAAPSTGYVCAIGYDQDGSRYIQGQQDYYRWDAASAQFWAFFSPDGLTMWAQQAGHVLSVQPGYPTAFGMSDGSTVDFIGLIYWLVERHHIFTGETMTKEAYQSVNTRAHEDPDFPITGR